MQPTVETLAQQQRVERLLKALVRNYRMDPPIEALVALDQWFVTGDTEALAKWASWCDSTMCPHGELAEDCEWCMEDREDAADAQLRP